MSFIGHSIKYVDAFPYRFKLYSHSPTIGIILGSTIKYID